MKKLYTIVALIMTTVFLLSACGKTEPAKKDEPAKKTEAKKEEAKKTEAKKEETAEPVKLVYWSMWNPTEPQAIELKKGVESFMAMHPEVQVDINWAGREIRKTLQPALDNGQVIDIWDEDLERVTKNWSSYAIDLEKYVAASYEATGGKPYQETVMANLQDMGRGFSEDGKLYALPYQC